jgi:isopenicillin-N N-acyltransferase-like protein
VIVSSSYPVVEINGTPFERGQQHGSKCKKVIDLRIEILKNLVENTQIFNLDWQEAQERGSRFIPHIDEYDSSLLPEMEGLADGADRPFEEVVLLNVIYELFSLNRAGVWSACTTLAATPEATKTGHTLMGQNDDWNIAFRDLFVVLRIEQTDGPTILQFCDAGTIGGNGLNSAGIGLCGNSILSGGWSYEGVPHMLLKRGALSKGKLTEATAAITAARRCSSHNYLLGSAEGEAIDLETTPNLVTYIPTEQGIVSHTNHFTVAREELRDCRVDVSPETVFRYIRAKKILHENLGNISVETIKGIFRDHFDRPYSICRHPEPHLPPMKQSQTNASMIMDLSERSLWLLKGLPCQGKYLRLDV